MNDLGQALAPHTRFLLLVLACGEDALAQRRQLSYQLAKCKIGPYQHTVWLDGIAKNLDPDCPVKLVKEGETQNFLEVAVEGKPLRFALYFGTLQNGKYFIHAKGPEREAAPPSQFSLFADLPVGAPADLYPYALLVPTSSEISDYSYELHMILGDQPTGSAAWQSGVRHYGNPFIVRIPREGETAPVEAVPFSPDEV